MARQIFTILMLLIGGLFLMQTCKGKEGAPAALRSYPVVEPSAEELRTLEATTDTGKVVVFLDDRGGVTDIEIQGAPVVRTVPVSRRPLGVMLRLATGATRVLAPGGWESVRLSDGGYEFIHTDGGREVRKSVRLSAKGDALEVTLTMSGAGDDIRGLELTGPSGVVLGSAIEGNSGALIKLGDEDRFFTFDGCIEYQRERRSKAAAEAQGATFVPNYYRRIRVEGDTKLERYGVLGSQYFLGLENLQGLSAINIDAYRAARDAIETDEIESWVSLTTDAGGSYETSFQLRWQTRDSLDLPTSSGQAALEPAQTYWLENDTFRAAFTDKGAALLELWLKKFSLVAGEPPQEGNWVPILRAGVRPGSRALTLSEKTGVYGADPANRVWAVDLDQERGRISFQLETAKGWRLEKLVTLPEPGRYDLGVEIRIHPPAGFGDPAVGYSLVGPAGTYVEDAYRGIIGSAPPAGVLLERRGGDNDSSAIEELEEEGPLRRGYGVDANQRGLLRAVGTRGSYFISALVTEERIDDKDRPLGHVTDAQVRAIELADAIERPDGELSRSSLAAQIKCAVPVTDGVASASYRLYAGPNEMDSLRPLRIEETIDWGMFGAIGRALMWLMKFLQGVVGSYGVAIMLMTLIVRGLLFPVSYRTQLGMQRYSKRLQKIKPELDALQKKYGNNKDKMNRERMRVMKEHKVGFPLGCLTIFIQMPIWFALFGALRVEFSLRHQNFLWVHDLSMPDRLFHMPWFADVPVLPEYFNLLPIVMLALWVTQQKLTPTPGAQTDPNVQMQMKMVKYMPYVFFFMLYNYAAALSVYMCVSSAWGIAESKLVRRAITKLD